jgi:hypothetical protein
MNISCLGMRCMVSISGPASNLLIFCMLFLEHHSSINRFKDIRNCDRNLSTRSVHRKSYHLVKEAQKLEPIGESVEKRKSDKRNKTLQRTTPIVSCQSLGFHTAPPCLSIVHCIVTLIKNVCLAWCELWMSAPDRDAKRETQAVEDTVRSAMKQFAALPM